MPKILLRFIVAIVVGGFLCLLFIPFERMRWVGSTDLEVEFLVFDATTRIPIPGATITIQSLGGSGEERDPKEFELKTDDDGRVKRLCKKCMCFGTSGWNIDTFSVRVPSWLYYASAAGYSSSDRTWLETWEADHRVQRLRPSSKLVVEIYLQRRGAESGAAANRGKIN